MERRSRSQDIREWERAIPIKTHPGILPWADKISKVTTWREWKCLPYVFFGRSAMNAIAYRAGAQHAGMGAVALDAIILAVCCLVLFISRRNKTGTAKSLRYDAGIQEELYYELEKLNKEEPNVNWRDEIAPVVREDADHG